MIYIDPTEARLKTILIMTSTEEISPRVVNNVANWEIQSYRGGNHYRSYTSEVFDDGWTAQRVKARHVVVYNNGTTGVTLAEFEVFGTGTYKPDNICCNIHNDATLHRAQNTSLSGNNCCQKFHHLTTYWYVWDESFLADHVPLN